MKSRWIAWLSCLLLAGCAARRLQPPESPGTTSSARSSNAATSASIAANSSPPHLPPAARAEPYPVTPASSQAGESRLDVQPAVAITQAMQPTPAAPQAPEPIAPGEPQDGELQLDLADIVSSVLGTFPLIQAAMLEGQITEGQRVATWGEFDLKIKAESLATPEGYYKNYRNLAKVEQGLWNGGTVFGQYRIGDGSFQPWYGERETNEGGEFKVGGVAPLLRGRRIDDRRTEIVLAQLRQAQVEPAVQAQVLQAVQLASQFFWSWVAAGRAYQAQLDLLQVTEERNAGYKRRVELKDLPAIELQQNEQLIAARQAKVIESQRKLQQSAIKLSLFLRDEYGRPMVPPIELLPAEFPEPVAPDPAQLEADVALALSRRPELRDLMLQRQQYEVELSNARNQLLPALDAVLEATKDVGKAASSKGDKTPFELEAGVLFDMPVQRRKAHGKVFATEGKLAQLAVKQQFTENKIRTEVQDAYSAMIAAYEVWLRARRSAELAHQLEVAERREFELGDSDLIRVALQETNSINATITVIDSQATFFQALADYNAALAVDPGLQLAPDDG